MVYCKVLTPFTEFVPGTGLVVGNVGKTVELPIRYAAQRRERGYVDYDDEAAAEEAETDAARPKTRNERRLLARSARRRAAADQAAAAVGGKRKRIAPKATKTAPKMSAPKKAAGKSAGTKRSSGKSELGTLRDEYKKLVGKNPSPGLKADDLKAKIAELKAASGSAPTVSSDAPVE